MITEPIVPSKKWTNLFVIFCKNCSKHLEKVPNQSSMIVKQKNVVPTVKVFSIVY